jgi:membrane protein
VKPAVPAQRSHLRRAIDFVTRDIWMQEPGELPLPRQLGLKLARILVLTARNFHQHRVLVQAAALTYYTVLSIVPVLAVSFAVARGLGAYDELKGRAIEPFLDRFLGANAPVAEVGPALEAGAEGSSDLRLAIEQVLAFVDRTNDLPLGVFGLLLFLYAAVKLLSAAERTLNDIWGIRRGRSWARRFTDYIAFVVVTPILLLIGTAGVGALSAIRRLPGVGGDLDVSGAVSVLLRCVPFLVFWVALTFAYLALPNTRVRARSALLGGAAAAILWLFSQFVYIELQVGIAKYNALYASFAAFPILLFWIFLSWSIFLIGAELVYAHHSVPLFASIARMGAVDQAFRESLALRLAGRIAEAFLEGRPPRGSAELSAELGVSPRVVNQVLESLVRHGLCAQTLDGEEDLYLPARDPEAIAVTDVLAAMRSEPDAHPLSNPTRLDERVERVLEGLGRESRASLYNYSLRELALAARAPESAEPHAGALREAPGQL